MELVCFQKGISRCWIHCYLIFLLFVSACAQSVNGGKETTLGVDISNVREAHNQSESNEMKTKVKLTMPLLLTDLIADGQIEKARELSKVI